MLRFIGAPFLPRVDPESNADINYIEHSLFAVNSLSFDWTTRAGWPFPRRRRGE